MLLKLMCHTWYFNAENQSLFCISVYIHQYKMLLQQFAVVFLNFIGEAIVICKKLGTAIW